MALFLRTRSAVGVYVCMCVPGNGHGMRKWTDPMGRCVHLGTMYHLICSPRLERRAGLLA